MAIASMRRDALAFFDRAASARSSTDVRSVRVIDNPTIPHPMSRLSKHRLMTGWIRERAYESHPRAAGISIARTDEPNHQKGCHGLPPLLQNQKRHGKPEVRRQANVI